MVFIFGTQSKHPFAVPPLSIISSFILHKSPKRPQPTMQETSFLGHPVWLEGWVHISFWHWCSIPLWKGSNVEKLTWATWRIGPRSKDSTSPKTGNISQDGSLLSSTGCVLWDSCLSMWRPDYPGDGWDIGCPRKRGLNPHRALMFQKTTGNAWISAWSTSEYFKTWYLLYIFFLSSETSHSTQ
jgi:hypothetical protein